MKWLSTADELQEKLRFATAAAALNATRIGADPPTWTEVEQFLHEI